MAIFSRSDYEDVVTGAECAASCPYACGRRYDEINNFEHFLAEERCGHREGLLYIQQGRAERAAALVDHLSRQWKSC